MTGIRFSANTGYLWKDLPFLDRIRQAAKNGPNGPIGCEYRPAGTTEEGLSWMAPFRNDHFEAAS